MNMRPGEKALFHDELFIFQQFAELIPNLVARSEMTNEFVFNDQEYD